MQLRDYDITFEFTYQPEITGDTLWQIEGFALIETNRSNPLGWSVMGVSLEGVSKWIEIPDLPGHDGHLYRAIVAFLERERCNEIADAMAEAEPSKADMAADAYRDRVAS